MELSPSHLTAQGSIGWSEAQTNRSHSTMAESLPTPLPPGSAVQSNKVVVALVDKRRVKGFVYNFSAMRETFSVFPNESAQKTDATEIKVKDVKAVFFVKD